MYEDHDLGGNTHLQAPELNMIDLVNQSITGRREELCGVVLREPSPELSATCAPSDVLSIKRGMVRENRQARAAQMDANRGHGKAQQKCP